MQLIQKASKAFLKERAVEKVAFGSGIIAGLDTIPAPGVPGLPYTVSVLTEANTLLSTTSVQAATGSHAGVTARNAAEKDWNTKFGETADAVSDRAKGDAEKIQRTGFHPTKAETTPAQLPDAPFGVTRTPGQAAAAISVRRPDSNRPMAYLFMAASPQAHFERYGNTICISVGTERIYVQMDTHPAANMQGLTANTELQIVVAAMNTAGTSTLSDPVLVTPQG